MSDTDIKAYIKQLNKDELKALQIAKEHLETSFNIKKSIGFLQWKKDNTK